MTYSSVYGGISAASNVLAASAMQQADLDAAVVALYEHKGAYNASTNSPDLDTTPSGIFKGDAYTVSVAGTFFAVALEAGDVIIADQDDPTTAAHWTIVNKNIDSSAFATAAQGALIDAEVAMTTGITAYATGGQTNAVELIARHNVITTCTTAGDSVKFQTAVAGMKRTVINAGVSPLDLFPNTADALENYGVNIAVPVAPNSSVTFMAIDATTWRQI